VVLHLIRQGTPEPVMFNIFARINTGGRPLSRQELRHALIPGPARRLLKDLAESEEYREATLGSVAPERMDDREMALRFLAFRLSDPENYVRPDFDDFLRDAMNRLNTVAGEQVTELRAEFARAMDAAREIFGEHAFRKRYPGQRRRSPINKALFEAVSVGLARRSDRQLDALLERWGEVVEKLSWLHLEREFERAISVGTGDVAKVRLRFARVDRMLEDVANA
jgi:hypothetical protein